MSSTAVDQEVACASVTQRARVRSPAGTSFLGEVFRVFSSSVRQMSGSFRSPRSPNLIWSSLSSSIIIHYGRQLPEMLTRPKPSNIKIFLTKILQKLKMLSNKYGFNCMIWNGLTQRTHTDPWLRLESLTPPGIESGQLDWRAEILLTKPQR